MKKHEGKVVRSVRDARAGDKGFVDGTDQVVVTLEDGTEKVVRRAEVTEEPPAKP